MHRKPLRPLIVIGWREHVALPGLDIHDLPAKIDTGARTTALHAEDIETYDKDGAAWVRFTPPSAAGEFSGVQCEAPIHDLRNIKNTSGIPQRRVVIRTMLTIAARHWHIDVSLTDRAAMVYPIIIGRRAIRGHRILVDPGRSYLTAHDTLVHTTLPQE